MSELSEPSSASSQQRPRAVFSNEDFHLIRIAIQNYLKEVGNTPDASKYSNLYHRLGRLL